MKTIKAIILALSILGFSYLIVGCINQYDGDRNQVQETPSEFPEWVDKYYNWTNYHQQAYEDDRIWFNKDSSAMFISGPQEGHGKETADRTIQTIKDRTYSVEKKNQ